MKPIQPSPVDASPTAEQPADSRSSKTPNADMQAEDTGSDASAGEKDQSGTPATRAMKQTSKTEAETGNRR